MKEKPYVPRKNKRQILLKFATEGRRNNIIVLEDSDGGLHGVWADEKGRLYLTDVEENT
jgi:hypothetical protein